MRVRDLRHALESFPDDAEVIIRATEFLSDGDVFIVASIRSVSLQYSHDLSEEAFVAIDADGSDDDEAPQTPHQGRHLKVVK